MTSNPGATGSWPTYRPTMRIHRLLLVATAIGSVCCGRALDSAPASAAQPAVDAGDAAVFCSGLIDVEGGVIPLAAARNGVVTEVPAGEGVRVTAGQPLVRLDADADQLAIEAATCRLRGAEETAAAAAAEPERFRLQVKQGEEQLAALESRLVNVQLQLETTRRLADLKQAGRNDVLAADARVDEAKHAVAAEKARLDALRLTDPSQRLTEANRQVVAAGITLREAELAASLAVLRAPCDALVLRVSAVPAVTVSAGQTLVILQPDRPLVARVPLDPEFAGAVRVGQRAEVRPESGPAGGPIWRGKVTALGGWYSARRPVGLELVPPSEARTLECVVRLDAEAPEPPRIGLEVQVRIEP